MWNFAAAQSEDDIIIDGTKGRLLLSTFGQEHLRLETANGEETFEGQNPRHVQAPLIQTIVDDLRGVGTCPSSGESAARTSRVMDIVLEAIMAGEMMTFGRARTLGRDAPRNRHKSEQ